MRTVSFLLNLLAGVAVVWALPQQAGTLELYRAQSLSSPGPSSHTNGNSTDFAMPPVSAWHWYAGEANCAPSPMAAKVDQVAREITRAEGDRARVLDESKLTTRRNAFGPTLLDSEAIFTAAARLIETAEHEIDLVSFAMEPDAQPYLELVRAFERRLSTRTVASPLRLRIYADHLSTMFLGGRARPKARGLLEPWLRVYREHKLDPQRFPIEIYIQAHGAFLYNHGARYSVHDKLVIVDGRYLHIGGANPQKKNNYGHPERDSAVVVKGEVAGSALAAFDALWSRSDFSCTIERRGDDYRSACHNRSTPFTVDHDAAVARPDLSAAGVAADACLPMTVLSKQRTGYRNVGGASNPWAKGLLAAVSSSAREISLSSPNMNTPQLQRALVQAMAERDVRVNLLLPFERNEPQVNSIGGFGSNERSMAVLRACALVAKDRSARDYQRLTTNFQGAWWVAEGQTERFSGDGPGCFHTKFASFDDQAVIVGSGNLDDQSFYHSSETSLFIDSPVVTRAVRQFLFEPDWRRAKRFDLSMPLLGPGTAKRDNAADRLLSDPVSLCSMYSGK